MKHGLATLSLTEVNEPLVKEAMLKEAGGLKSLLSGIAREGKSIGTGAAVAGGGAAGAGLGGAAGLLGMGEGDYLDQLGALAGGGAAGGASGTLAAILLSGLLKRKIPNASFTGSGALGALGCGATGVGVGSATADALKG